MKENTKHLHEQPWYMRIIIRVKGIPLQIKESGGMGCIRYVYKCLKYKDENYIIDLWAEDSETGKRVNLFG